MITDLVSYLRTELAKPTRCSAEPKIRKGHLSDVIPWLFPEEVDQLEASDADALGSDQQFESMLAKADMISAAEGGTDDATKKLVDVPLGLKNRWRIWKILGGIGLSDS